MNQDNLKKAVAEHALTYVEEDSVVGVGTGSTTNFFIDALASMKGRIDGAVASSEASAERLKSHGIPVYDLTSVANLDVYIDGADEVTKHKHMIKGGGGALTREKIVAATAKQFICMVDQTKLVGVLGAFPIAIEVIPMARSYVGREIVKLGGDPAYREGFVTDNGNIILDVYYPNIMEPVKLEQRLNQITGVVCNGLFAQRPADVVLIGTEQGVDILS